MLARVASAGPARTVLLAFTLIVALAATARADTTLGPFGPEGPRMLERLWLLPSGDPAIPLRATVFQPAYSAPMPWGGEPGDPRPMVVINHGTSEWTRQAVAMPVYYWLSRWFVERGFVVVLPQRRGHGATGGDLVEARGNCADPDHYTSGRLAAADIAAAIGFMHAQEFVSPSGTVVVGISSGGWASLALAGLDVDGIRGVVSFAGGRGGHAWGKPGAICGAERLIEAAGRYGEMARVPSLWLYAENDTFFGPELAHGLHEAYVARGGDADLHVLPPYGNDGHSLADDQAGWRLWGNQMTAFLARVGETPVAGAPLRRVGAGPMPSAGTAAEGASKP